MLVNYYNLIIKHQFYLQHWLDTLDVVIEKGKGPILRKLRTIQLLEADLQIIIRMHSVDLIQNDIESDNRVSKANYGSRKFYLIDNIILEKIILYNASKQNYKKNA